MAKPRVFISSTYYDLKHIRASLDLFVDSLGYEPVLSEKGDIAYTHDRALDESCYREVENSDIFVLLIGGRYGSEASGTDKKPGRTFFDRYESITKKEYESAAARDVPIYIFIEKGVYSEYQTFLRNKERTDINYAHVDSVNVFQLIEEILLKPRNNPIQTFEKFEDIESWLRDQWAGLFRELLRRQSQQQQLAGLTTQVADLKETNETLKKYLEAVMKGSGRQENSRLIESEEKRLEEVRRTEKLRANTWIRHSISHFGVSFEEVVNAISKCTSLESYAELLTFPERDSKFPGGPARTLRHSDAARRDFNEARHLLDLTPIDFPPKETDSERKLLRPLPAVLSEPLAETTSRVADSPAPEPAKTPLPVKKSSARKAPAVKASKRGAPPPAKRASTRKAKPKEAG